MEDVLIREICPADNTAMAAIIRRIFEDLGVPKTGTAYEDKYLDHLYEFYQQPRAAYYVVIYEHQLVGGGGIAPLKSASVDICELQKMYFAETVRGKGIGKRLLQLCLDKARDLGFNYCYLETMPYMEAAQSLYRSFGFDYLQGPVGNTGHSSCHVWMLKALENPAIPE